MTKTSDMQARPVKRISSAQRREQQVLGGLFLEIGQDIAIHVYKCYLLLTMMGI